MAHLFSGPSSHRLGRILFVFFCCAAQALLALAALPLTCTTQAAGVPLIRAEGVSDLAGDLLFLCTGGEPRAPAQPLPQFNLQVFSNPTVALTSRVLASSGGFTEALLFIDQPTPGSQTICGSPSYPYSAPPGIAHRETASVHTARPAPGIGFSINSCPTNILFPFVSNQSGFDTGIAVANAAKDPFFTSGDTGACEIHFFRRPRLRPPSVWYGRYLPEVQSRPRPASRAIYDRQLRLPLRTRIRLHLRLGRAETRDGLSGAGDGRTAPILPGVRDVLGDARPLIPE